MYQVYINVRQIDSLDIFPRGKHILVYTCASYRHFLRRDCGSHKMMVDSCSRIVVCFIITDTLAASSVSVVLGKDIIIYTDTYNMCKCNLFFWNNWVFFILLYASHSEIDKHFQNYVISKLIDISTKANYIILYRGYYTVSRRYGFYVRVAREHKIHATRT